MVEMETKTRKIGPPPFLAAAVERLIPGPRRGLISGDWYESYVSPRGYIRKAARAIPVIVADEVRRTFNLAFVTGEACVLYISFAGARLLPLLAVIAAVIAVLTVREAYLDPARRSQQEAATHGIVGSTAAFLSQVLLGIAAPSLTLPYGMMIRGAAISLMMMSAWRLVFYLKTTPADEPGAARRAVRESYSATRRMNILWVTACIVLIFTSTEAVPATIKGRDFLFVFIPLVVLFVAYRLKLNVPDRTAGMSGPLHLSGDPYKQELSVKRDMLWTPGRSADSGVPWSACLEVLFFVLLALPLCIAVWRWWSGDPAAGLVDWFQVGANFGAFVSLLVLWLYIKRLNRKMVNALQEMIDAANRELQAEQKK